MSTQGLPWFRMYTDFLNDPKLISLAFEDQRHFIGVLALKCAGALDQDCDPMLMDRIVAQRLWIDHSIVREVKKRLVAAGLVDMKWQPLGWEKRQFRSDKDPTGAERQRRFRARKLHNTLCNADVTGVDTETEAETNKEDKLHKGCLSVEDLVVEGIDLQHAEDWITLRKAKRQPLTLTAWNGVKAEAKKAGMTPSQAVETAVHAGWAGFNAEWGQKNGRKEPGVNAWWLSAETKLAKAIEVGAGAAWPGETEAAWGARIHAAIDNRDKKSALSRPQQAIAVRDPKDVVDLKSVISQANQESFREAASRLGVASRHRQVDSP